jgi:hypothetical protein
MEVSIEDKEAIKSMALIGFLLVALGGGVALIFIGISHLWGAILLVLGVLSLIELLRKYGKKEKFWKSVLALILMIIGLLIGGVISGLIILIALFFPIF